MGAQVLIILSWALLSHATATRDQKQLISVNSSVVKDSVSAGSGMHPKLYHNVRLGSYAAPHGVYSLYPAVATSQLGPYATSHVGPVGLHSVPQAVVQNPGMFKDSYGKFVKPQMAYTTQPQQFVQIQALPAHLSQPLASSPMYQYKTTAPHFFVGSQYRLPSSPTITVGPNTQQQQQVTSTGFGGQPHVYSESFRSFSPSSSHYSYGSGFPATFISSTSPKPEQLSTPESQPNITTQENTPEPQETKNPVKTKIYTITNKKYTRNKDTKPQESQIDSQNIQTQTKITAIVNGEPTTVTLDTKPPLPLLDLGLLEPLTFDNPLVPQLQHYLPKISPATYAALADYDNDDGLHEQDEEKHHQQEIIVEHVKTYDTVKKPKPTYNKAKKPEKKPKSTKHNKPETDIPVVYEINTPNRKEIYKEEVVSYKKETKPEPEHFSYDSEKQDKPKVYSYVHNSQEPLAVTRVNYHNGKETPKTLYSSGEQQEDQNHDIEQPHQSYHHEADHSEESSAEGDDQHRHQGQNHHNDYSNGPASYQHHAQHQPEQDHYSQYHTDSNEHKDSSEESHTHSELRELPEDHHHHVENHDNHHHHQRNKKYKQEESHIIPKPSNSPKQSAKYQSKPLSAPKTHKSPINSHKHQYQYHHSSPPRAAQYHSDHIKSKPNHSSKLTQKVVSIPVPMKYINQPVKMKVSPTFVPVLPEWAENMRLLNSPKSHAAIKVDPNQHIQFGPTTPRIISIEHFSNPLNAKVQQVRSKPQVTTNSKPSHVHQKSKRIIIKDESPVELHMHAERVMEEMTNNEENNEDDFEKAYKASAFGFPAYDGTEDEVEKDIFNPDAYGVPHEHLEFNIEDNPFQKYQKEGDSFPKSARLSYKDSADNTKEDYYLDYSVSKPESFLDHHNHKANYYKTFKKNRPEKILTVATDDNKKRKPEKYVAATAISAPSYIKPKQKQFFSHYAKPVKVEFDYSKALHDSAGYHSLPVQYRFKTEPQFQFGSYGQFRPVVHYDGELASMATNNSPNTEKPSRKKLHKDKWYIRKTTTDIKNR